MKVSKGEGHFLRYGLSGARGEAESGFRTVRTQAMPVFNRVMADTGDTNLALLQTLLHLMAGMTIPIWCRAAGWKGSILCSSRRKSCCGKAEC